MICDREKCHTEPVEVLSIENTNQREESKRSPVKLNMTQIQKSPTLRVGLFYYPIKLRTKEMLVYLVFGSVLSLKIFMKPVDKRSSGITLK